MRGLFLFKFFFMITMTMVYYTRRKVAQDWKRQGCIALGGVEAKRVLRHYTVIEMMDLEL